MGTITITAAGFANTSVTQPSEWPADVTWPGSQSPNGTKSVTISDADWAHLIAWAADNYFAGTVANPATPTAPQILLAWVTGWFNATKNSVQQHMTAAPTVPPQITVT
jgi:hypothetical protein